MENDKQKRQNIIYGKDIVGDISQKSAIALEYDEGDVAPKVIASGKGYVAEKIIQKADEHKIPVHKDEKLAKSLEKLEIGEYIPKELYQVVAEVLVYVDAMDKIKGKVMDKVKEKEK
ncbi:MAG: EscU/YscU/HrcU family type III secretion system export apparatus switch protein [Butyribacter sp.]|nr:EscU/YscU/HrcU family type III secretion system export apparatus switch protein [bacterium]MDY3853482.1 EscU/YscU/HrcU family type III secretion system export apparatus switch protein [Butyribacter sp.]